jgi:hypothetical protein
MSKDTPKKTARSTALAPAPNPEGSLSRYLNDIKKFPMLEADEEFTLAKDYAESGDKGAAHKLVTSHLRLVAKIAMGYRGYGLPIGEVISEGKCGADARRAEIRPRSRLPPRHLCHVVDTRADSGIYFTLMVAGQNRHHGGAEKAVFQFAAAQGRD